MNDPAQNLILRVAECKRPVVAREASVPLLGKADDGRGGKISRVLAAIPMHSKLGGKKF